ncbi:unnamed protein product [Staurois parvus]|uniref:Uncharacterized protein n=1 Tax=Staurois parvus TaxID=386267 RepID=A0ABN9CA01_9NEOB|nr:unnamed protein product [Staurois parvus]
METHFMKFSMHCCANLKTTKSGDLAIALQHALAPLCHFTWPTTWCLSCCCSQLLPRCYNTTNSGPWNI